MRIDPQAESKIQQVIKAVCHEWGVSESDVLTASKRSTAIVNEARCAISYIVMHRERVVVPRKVLAKKLGVNGAQVSKYAIAMRRNILIYDELKDKIGTAIYGVGFLVNQTGLPFDEVSYSQVKARYIQAMGIIRAVLRVVGTSFDNTDAERHYSKGLQILFIKRFMSDVTTPELKLFMGLHSKVQVQQIDTAAESYLSSTDHIEFEIAFNDCLRLLKAKELQVCQMQLPLLEAA